MKREPKILLHRFKIIFQVGCFLIALYFTSLFSAQYAENTDEQLIIMKSFNQDKDQYYSTFSFCFKGADFRWFHNLEVYSSYRFDTTQFERMIRGQTANRYERNVSHRSYTKTPVFFVNNNETDFNDFNLKMADFIKSLHFATERNVSDTIISNPKDWNTLTEPPMYLSYQTANRICFSRNVNDSPNTVRTNDLITIDSSIIRFYDDTEVDVFVHYPNQLIRSFGAAKYSTTFSELQAILKGSTPKILEFKLTECKRIKKRSDSKERCNQDILNYDHYLHQRIGEKLKKKLGCVPIYLRAMLLNTTDLKICNTPLELKEAFKVLDDTATILNENDIPCDEMLVLTIDSINYYPNPIPKDISIQFQYTEKIYEEIKYIKAIGFESWLSNVGGFVGIFLGYSMMQFPEFLLLFTSAFTGKRIMFWAGM